MKLTAAALIALTASPCAGYTIPYEWRNGGVISQFSAETDMLKTSGQSATIRGTCKSSCTMFLAVSCVRPDAVLAFHGPSSYGRPLPPEDFERWARVMSSYYPPEIARWYLDTVRADRAAGVNEIHMLTGAEAIEHGARGC